MLDKIPFKIGEAWQVKNKDGNPANTFPPFLVLEIQENNDYSFRCSLLVDNEIQTITPYFEDIEKMFSKGELVKIC